MTTLSVHDPGIAPSGLVIHTYPIEKNTNRGQEMEDTQKDACSFIFYVIFLIDLNLVRKKMPATYPSGRHAVYCISDAAAIAKGRKRGMEANSFIAIHKSWNFLVASCVACHSEFCLEEGGHYLLVNRNRCNCTARTRARPLSSSTRN